MRRQTAERPPLVSILLERWRAAGDRRARQLEAGERVLLSADDLPPDYVPRRDRCMGHPDDFELGPDGQLETSLAYWSRRLDAAPLRWLA